MKTLKLIFVAIFTLAITGQSAFALSTIDTSWAGWGGAAFYGHGVGYGSGSVWPNPTYPKISNKTQVSVGIGGDSFITSNKNYDFSASGSFNTWCVDITHWMIGSQVTYAVGGTAELTADFTTDRVIALHKLANENYASINDTNGSAAFQLAVWTIMFGDKTNGQYNLNNDHFVASANDTGYATATSWLRNLDTNPVTGNYSITYLYQPSPLADNTQDMVVFTQTPVPEPGTMMMIGLGMLGLAVYGKRRRNKEA